ncbi:hypothetical protein [Saccharothrix sp. NRRL B-16348]|uniref:hypothetical protein n=1 Tax=Saccharothrix sp. NRRL B-16348 TaxID=1415542 RepID=UPI0006AEC443|nr:hypothetical protein [Saccharothrix sp. NRRL B-16348]
MLKQTAAILALLLLGSASPAFADPWGTVDCGRVLAPVCDLGAGNSHQPNQGLNPDHPAGADQVGGDDEDPFVDCGYKPIDYEAPGGQPQEAGGWFMVLCSPDGKDPLSHGPVWVPAGGAQPALSPEQVAEVARNRLRLPEVTIAASPAEDQLVNLPTWLWLSGGWEEVSANASVTGVSVTAVAKPRSVTWSMGDGGSVTCTGAGTPYGPHAEPTSPSPDCGHIYRRSSADQSGHAFPVSAIVRWMVTWSGAGQGGTFPDMTTTGTASFRVAESHALNNGG